MSIRFSNLVYYSAAVLVTAGISGAYAQSTNIAVGPSVLQPSVKRLGVNLNSRDYYDAGQITKNLVMRNPGFEGEIYQSTIQCAAGTPTTCLDNDPWSAWPNGFWNGATFQFFYGAAQGATGTISNYTAATGGNGGTFTFSQSGIAPANGDYMIVRMKVPGNPAAGWWPSTSGNGSIAANTSDLPPNTTGLQTVAISAPTGSDSVTLASYFDGDAGRSFILLSGTYQLTFKAKGIGGSNQIALSLQRPGTATYLNQIVNLTNSWATYTYTFTASELGANLNNVALSFGTVGADSFYMDDVSLAQTNSNPANTTAFLDPVVTTLQTLQPGSLRFWANQLGDTLDNLIADQFGRQRSGFLAFYTEQDDISYGLQEFLQLSAAVGAEPWIVVPSTFSLTDASNLIEYLAGSSSTPYGSKRAAGGNPNPWTSSFTKIHLEFGNEEWNGSFKGGSIEYPQPYGQQAQAIFGAMRSNPAYIPSAFDLVLGGQAVDAGRNQSIQNYCNNNDSFSVAPYMMNTVNSYSDNQDLFGSTFAEPEALISSAGSAEGVSGGMMTLNQQAIQASSHPVPLVMYEMNFSTTQGSITQAALNSYVSSLGAGLATIDAMLQQMAQGVLTQNLWNLTQYNFQLADGNWAYLYGTVVDMGPTNQRRPQYLALQLANQAITTGASMLQTLQTGANPTWNQPLVNTVQLPNAHYLQSYAFSSGSDYSLVVFNLNLTDSLPVTFSGTNAPSGTVQQTLLTSVNVTDTNETAEVVDPVTTTLTNFNPSNGLSLPPYSMTVLTWTGGTSTAPPPATNPPVISSVSAGSVSGTSATITWRTDQASTSQVEYGTAVSYGSLSANNSSLVTTHAVTLTNLTPATNYDYAAISANSNGQSTTSANFTFTTTSVTTSPPPASAAGITKVGGAHNNTGVSTTPSSLSIPYSSGSGNTVVVTCALGSTASSIVSITDSGSAWAQRAFVNGTGVRSEIWSTPAGGSVASTSFTVSISGPVPTSCGLEEYAGVQSLGNTATSYAISGSWSISLTTQDPNNYVVAGLGANSYYGYTAVAGTIEQLAGLTPNSGNNYVETALCDNTAATATSVSCASVSGPTAWAAIALELRTGGGSGTTPPQAAPVAPTITSVAAGSITSTSATITWTTNQQATSQVAYGASTSYGSLSAASASTVTSHSVNLTGLTPGTSYDYAAISVNATGQSTTSTNFTFSTAAAAAPPPASAGSVIARVGGAHGNTGVIASPTSLSIPYSSGSGNTVVVTCALGSTSSSISSITDSGSTWAMQAFVNGSGVRSEIWTTNAGGSVASKSFTINISGPVPTSCGLEEYSGVQAIGNTATSYATSGIWSVSLTTQDPNNRVVAGLGANSYYGYTATAGTLLQLGGLTANSGSNYAETGLLDNTASIPGSVLCTSVSGPVAWAAVAVELRTANTSP